MVTQRSATAAAVPLAELNDDDLELVTRLIDALVTKTRLKTLAGNAS